MGHGAGDKFGELVEGLKEKYRSDPAIFEEGVNINRLIFLWSSFYGRSGGV